MHPRALSQISSLSILFASLVPAMQGGTPGWGPGTGAGPGPGVFQGGPPGGSFGAPPAGFGEMPAASKALSEQHYPGEHRREIALETGVGPVTRLVAGDLTGDGQRDVIALDGALPVLFFGPGYFDSDTRLGEDPAIDVAFLTGDYTPAWNHLAITTLGGLRKLWIDYEDEDEDFVQSEPLGPATWAGAQRVITLQASQGAPHSLAGLDGKSQTLLWLLHPLTAPTAAPSDPLPSKAFDLFAADFSGGEGEEVVVVQRGGIEVYRQGEGLVTRVVMPLADGFGTRLVDDLGERDRVAIVVRPMGDSHQYLLVWGSDGVLEAPLDLGLIGVHGIASADVDMDGHDDICLSIEGGLFHPVVEGSSSAGPTVPGLQSSQADVALESFLHRGAVVLFHRGSDVSASSPGTFGWGPGEAVPIDLGLNDRFGAAAPCPPLLADMTQDLDPELVLFAADARRLLVAENAAIDHAKLTVSTRPALSHVTIDENDPLGGLARYELRLEPPDVIPEWANSLMIEQWVQPSADGLHFEGLHRYPLAMPLDWSVQHELYLYVPPLDLQMVSYLQLRFVLMNASGEVTRSAPSTFHAVALYEVTSAYLKGFSIPAIVGRQAAPRHYFEPPWDEADLTWSPPGGMPPPGGGGGVGGATGPGGPAQKPGDIYGKVPPPNWGVGVAELGVGTGDLPLPPRIVDDPSNPPRSPSIEL